MSTECDACRAPAADPIVALRHAMDEAKVPYFYRAPMIGYFCNSWNAQLRAQAAIPPATPRKLSDPEAAADVAALQAEMVADPKKAEDLLRSAGIITADGKLAPEFGGEATDDLKGPEHG